VNYYYYEEIQHKYEKNWQMISIEKKKNSREKRLAKAMPKNKMGKLLLTMFNCVIRSKT